MFLSLIFSVDIRKRMIAVIFKYPVIREMGSIILNHYIDFDNALSDF